jgi:hypothetical protein
MSCWVGFVARGLILLQVMRAAGLGVVVEVGPGSMFNEGDRVTGSWGVFPVFCPISVCFICLSGMTEYAVMKDSKLEKIVYVFLSLSIFLTYPCNNIIQCTAWRRSS